MQYEANSQSNGTPIASKSSLASSTNTSKFPGRDSLNGSLDICEELACIKREVITLKDQVWNRVHDDMTPSEGSSIHSSIVDTQNDCLVTEDHTLASHRPNKENDENTENIAIPSGYQEFPSFSKSLDTSSFNLEWANKKKFSDFQTEIKNKPPVERERLFNGTAIDPIKAFEGKPYTIKSTQNDLLSYAQEYRLPQQKQTEDTMIYSITNPPHSLELIINDIGSSDSQCGINVPYLGNNSEDREESGPARHDNTSRMKYRELMTAPEKVTYEEVSVSDLENEEMTEDEEERRRMLFRRKKEASLGNTNGDEVYLSRREELGRANQRMLDEEEDDEDEPLTTNTLIKKTLSIIFSTNESCPSTPPRSVVQRISFEGMSETTSALQSNRSRRSRDTRRSMNSARKEITEQYEEKMSERSHYMQREEKGEYKETQESEHDLNVGTTTLGSVETFMGLMYMTKLQNKGNKDMYGKLNRLMELHVKQMEKYEKTIEVLNEKNEKYSKGNELLVKTLKACEKEIDQLALNNQTLHKNVLMFEEDLNVKNQAEKYLTEALLIKQKENDKLKEELQRKQLELEDMKSKYSTSVAKAENVRSYAKSCEDSIYAIDQTLKKLTPGKTGPKVPIALVYKVLESILAETSKFVEKLDTTTTISNATLETEGFKSLTPKENGRAFTSFGTDESAGSTVDNRGRSKAKSKPVKSANPSVNSSPQPKATRSAARIPTLESPGNKSVNQVLIQRLLNSHNGKPRSVSNNTKKSIDKNSGMEKDYMGREKLESKSVKRINNMGNQRERESYSSPPLEKTPEKAKTQLKKKKSVVDDEKIKENLRKRVIRNLSPISQKR